jgi:hypothetical protein
LLAPLINNLEFTCFLYLIGVLAADSDSISFDHFFYKNSGYLSAILVLFLLVLVYFYCEGERYSLNRTSAQYNTNLKAAKDYFDGFYGNPLELFDYYANSHAAKSSKHSSKLNNDYFYYRDSGNVVFLPKDAELIAF